jgi:hypothetical protein
MDMKRESTALATERVAEVIEIVQDKILHTDTALLENKTLDRT